MKALVLLMLLTLSSHSMAECSSLSERQLQLFYVAQAGMDPSLPKGRLTLVASGFIFDAMQLERGDVVLFCAPFKESEQEYVFLWRIIGLPGDVVTLTDDVISLNGKKVDRNLVEDDGERLLYQEQLGDVSYKIVISRKTAAIEEREYTVPEEHLFLLGDNRSTAYDSRHQGFIPISKIFGLRVF